MSESYYREMQGYIELSKKVKTYLDVSLSFKPSPITNDITLLTNEQAINNAIKNVIMFLPSEVPFFYDFGSTTSRFLFDVIDDVTAGLVADEIKRAVLFCEPRVTFTPINPEEVDISALYGSTSVSTVDDLFFQDDMGVSVDVQPDQNSLAVTVKYRIVGGQQIYRVQEILTPTR